MRPSRCLGSRKFLLPVMSDVPKAGVFGYFFSRDFRKSSSPSSRIFSLRRKVRTNQMVAIRMRATTVGISHGSEWKLSTCSRALFLNLLRWSFAFEVCKDSSGSLDRDLLILGVGFGGGFADLGFAAVLEPDFDGVV